MDCMTLQQFELIAGAVQVAVIVAVVVVGVRYLFKSMV